MFQITNIIPAPLMHEAQCIETCRSYNTHEYTVYDKTDKKCVCAWHSNFKTRIDKPDEQWPPVSKQDCFKFRYSVSNFSLLFISLPRFTKSVTYPSRWIVTTSTTADKCSGGQTTSLRQGTSPARCPGPSNCSVVPGRSKQRKWLKQR